MDIDEHVWLMRDALQSYVCGEHLLLIGNQGVGKNKLADRLLQAKRTPPAHTHPARRSQASPAHRVPRRRA